MIRVLTPIRKTWLWLLMLLMCAPSLQAKRVNEASAANIAKRFIRLADKGVKRMMPAKAAKQSSEEQPYYIFTGADGKGFVIVAADDVARPVLGYSVDGVISDNAELPAPMEDWLSSVSKQIMQAREQGVTQTAEVAQEWNADSVGTTIVQLQTAQWNQFAPYNNQCPMDKGSRSITGCACTAHAILMKYYGYPLAGRGTTPAYITNTKKILVPERDLNHAYDWDNMPMEYLNGQYNEEQANSVAMLMADIGAAIQADYAKEVTQAAVGKSGLYKYFDYYPGKLKQKDDFDTEDWYQMLREELDKSRPVIYRAVDVADGEGHIFLLDGYTDKNFFGVNWGWGGYGNGYFTLDAMHVENYKYDTGQLASFSCVPMPNYEGGDVAQVGNMKYPSLVVAIDDAPDGVPTTIEMLNDEEILQMLVPEKKDVAIHLNDNSIKIKFGIINLGRLSVTGTDSSLISCQNNNEVFSNYGVLDINGGTYKNTLQEAPQGETDYRRCLWSDVNTQTRISNATFEAGGQVICTNGRLIIESGTYTCTGNSIVVSNFSTTDSMKILGGNFINNATSFSGNDSRCSLWSTQNSKTYVGNASFTNKRGTHNMFFHGLAEIDGAVVETEIGNFGCVVGQTGNVLMDDCRMAAKVNFYALEGGKVSCKGGLYSTMVNKSFLADGYQCVANTQEETSGKYPYRVQQIVIDGLRQALQDEGKTANLYYDAKGMQQSGIKRGMNIIRRSDGKTVKVFSK